MVTKPEHHLGDRLRHRRRVYSGEIIDQEALERGELELELPEPSPEPGAEAREPWCFADEDRMGEADRERLRLYRSFLDGLGEREER